MKYLGLTQKTCNWLLSNSDYLTALKTELKAITTYPTLSEGIIAVGALRISALDQQLICIWNNDYISGTDYEDWGFIKLQSPMGLFNEDTIFEEVLEREIYIINQRLQGFILPAEKIYLRNIADKMHTCLAGRGEKARQFSIGWFEDHVSVETGKFHSIICLGPSNISGFTVIQNQLKESGELLPKLLRYSHSILVKSKSRPILDIPVFLGLKDRFNSENLKKGNALPVESPPQLQDTDLNDKYSLIENTYYDWVASGSKLTEIQRKVLESDLLLKQPIRIIGAAGTGKSLLMQLLAMRRLIIAKELSQTINIFYVVHNTEMANTVWERFETLGASEFLMGNLQQKLIINTLFEHSFNELELGQDSIIDKDAYQTKQFQRHEVAESIKEIFEEKKDIINTSSLFEKINSKQELMELFSELISNEIAIAIKGQDLTNNRKKYIDSEKPLSRLHGVLNTIERGIVFSIYERYSKKVFEDLGILDSDDIAITYLAHLRTPLWQMKRKKLGFDFLFVDETQLFNQNERMLFRFLTKTDSGHVPIVLALDEAQELKGVSNVGFGLLGIEDLANKTLPDVHRCTPSILKLAFFIISRTNDLFGVDFPNFTSNSSTLVPDSHPLATSPRLVVRQDIQGGIAKSVLKEIRSLRKNNIRQIAIVIHTERYYNEIVKLLITEDLPVIVNVRRGEFIDPKKPIVYISTPENIGGQEFEAVIAVGLEYGVVPPIVDGHAGLTLALEQQSLREMYLSFTRAKYQLVVVNSKHSTPSPIIKQAIDQGLIIFEEKIEANENKN